MVTITLADRSNDYSMCCEALAGPGGLLATLATLNPIGRRCLLAAVASSATRSPCAAMVVMRRTRDPGPWSMVNPRIDCLGHTRMVRLKCGQTCRAADMDWPTPPAIGLAAPR